MVTKYFRTFATNSCRLRCIKLRSNHSITIKKSMDAANYSRSSRILLIFVLTFPNLFQWDTTKRIATPKMIPKMFADSTRPMARSIIVLPARKTNKSFIIFVLWNIFRTLRIIFVLSKYFRTLTRPSNFLDCFREIVNKSHVTDFSVFEIFLQVKMSVTFR